MWQNSKKNCDKTKKTKNCENGKKLPWELVGCQGVEVIKFFFWQNLKTQIVRGKNLKTQNVTKLKNSNCDTTQKLKLWQNSKTETETKHKNFKCDKIQKLKLWQN